MLTVDHPRDLKQHVGRELGPSDWIIVDQEMIDRFAEATGDHQWIHVDVERAKREMPGGKTIAHGFLTLSLIPRLAESLLRIKNRRQGINYGSNKVRFVSPVPCGSRVRLRERIIEVQDVEPQGVRMTAQMTVELDGQERPALVAETITLHYG
jgi:acyl dehydratase